MLFNSYIFILCFLPTTLAGFLLLARYRGLGAAKGWLVLASLAYYGWWNPSYLWLIMGSAVFNYRLGEVLKEAPSKSVLTFGVVANLGLLGYYKYANFFVDNLSVLTGWSYTLEVIILPLAISFFTFQQIAYLVDTYRKETGNYNFVDYLLFVSFFPQLIAGPIVHHKEMMPQFAKAKTYRFSWENISIGASYFAVGLFKKVLLADNLSPKVHDIFTQVEKPMYAIDAWGGALAYTFQIYFDFSGYCDMAIGLGFLFGIMLPINFNSPYKATNIIDFWRRWHITLSRFLKDYLYIPLGGNRLGQFNRYRNLLITMILGGLWHGAGWVFVVWGLLHGLYLCANHAFIAVQERIDFIALPKWSTVLMGRLVTLFAVVIAWVFFRSDNIDQALALLGHMFGYGESPMLAASTVLKTKFFYQLLLLIPVVWFLPNTQELFAFVRPRRELKAPRFSWRPNWLWAAATVVLLATCILSFAKATEFLYYQF